MLLVLLTLFTLCLSQCTSYENCSSCVLGSCEWCNGCAVSCVVSNVTCLPTPTQPPTPPPTLQPTPNPTQNPTTGPESGTETAPGDDDSVFKALTVIFGLILCGGAGALGGRKLRAVREAGRRDARRRRRVEDPPADVPISPRGGAGRVSSTASHHKVPSPQLSPSPSRGHVAPPRSTSPPPSSAPYAGGGGIYDDPQAAVDAVVLPVYPTPSSAPSEGTEAPLAPLAAGPEPDYLIPDMPDGGTSQAVYDEVPPLPEDTLARADNLAAFSSSVHGISANARIESQYRHDYNRAKAEAALASQPVGSFILRPSSAGDRAIAVSFVRDVPGNVDHCVVILDENDEYRFQGKTVKRSYASLELCLRAHQIIK